MAIVNIVKEPEYYLPAAITDDGKLGLMSYEESLKLSGIASGAEVNQNAFSTIKVGSTNVVADNKTDTLELVAGNNITLTPDVNNDKITILSKNSFPEVSTGLGYTSTVSGNPVTVTDALPYLAESVVADIEPIQNLNGYDHPWVGGAGKNKFPNNTDPDNNTSSMTVEKLTNGYKLTATNTAQYQSCSWVVADASVYAGKNVSFNALGTYTGGTHLSRVRLEYDNAGGTQVSAVAGDLNQGCTLAIPAGATGTIKAQLYLSYGQNCTVGDATTFYNIQFEEASSPTTYEPWENICPISGRTSETISQTDADEQTTTVTIQLGQTVYGGMLNVTTGVMTVLWVMKVLDGTEDITWGINNATASRQGVYANLVSILSDCKTGGGKMLDSVFNCFETAEYLDVNKAYIETNNASNIWLNMGFEPNKFADSAAFKTWLTTNNIQFTYELATPQTIQLTPTQLTMLKGYNRLSSDGGGDIALTYLADSITGSETGKPLALSLKSDTLSTLTASFKGNTTDREYAVGLDKNGNLSVNVPWPTITTSTTDLEDGTSPLATGAIYLVYET